MKFSDKTRNFRSPSATYFMFDLWTYCLISLGLHFLVKRESRWAGATVTDSHLQAPCCFEHFTTSWTVGFWLLLFACPCSGEKLTITLLPVGNILWAYLYSQKCLQALFLDAMHVFCLVVKFCFAGATCHWYANGSKQHRKHECRLSSEIRIHFNVCMTYVSICVWRSEDNFVW